MERLIKDKIKETSGASSVIAVGLIFIFLLIGFFATDALRVFAIQENVSDELYRASNLSIKAAMYDSDRHDAVSHFDENVAKNTFYTCLYENLNLNSNLERWEDGDLEYRIVIDQLDMDGINSRLSVSATVYSPSKFFNGVVTWDFPVKVKSRNMRVD